MHHLLAQQLRRAGVSAETLAPPLRQLLDLVDETYRDADAQQALADRQNTDPAAMRVGELAHELNNVVAAVLSFADLAAEALGPNHPVAADIQEIASGARRAAGVTQQLLTISREQAAQSGVVALSRARGSGPRRRAG